MPCKAPKKGTVAILTVAANVSAMVRREEPPTGGLSKKGGMMMDKLTQRILDAEQEFRDHPERFTVTLKCPDCGIERERVFPKNAVARYTAEHDGRTTIKSWCDNCAPSDGDDREETV